MSEMVERVAKAICGDAYGDAEAMARAAIAVMREPTEAMEAAGAKASDRSDANLAGLIWEDMIDEALK